MIKKGTVSIEYFPFYKWFSVFRFYEPSGVFRNFYCNVGMPPQYSNGVLDFIDLDIDVVVWPDWKIDVLDRVEFEENTVKFGYPDEVVHRANESLTELLEWIEKREFPFG